MGLIAPFALGFLGLALPIILFYMLKLRRQETLVSSNLLWLQALRDLQANAPWQRLQRNLLLFLQLLILALLASAIARPFFEGSTVITGNVIVLLDGSASMQATDVKPSRFEAAKARVSQMVDDLGPDDQVTIVLVSDQAEVVVSSSRDKPSVKSALNGLKAKNGKANYADAVALAVASSQRMPNSSIVVVSDGGIGDLPADRVPAPVHFVPIGTSSNNVAVSSIAIRDSAEGTQLFLALANHGDTAYKGLASIYVDGQLFDSREVDLGPGLESGLSWSSLPEDTELVYVHLDAADDLALDNSAWALRAAGGKVKTLLVSNGNLFLERALSLLPNVELSKMPSDSSTLPDGFDLYVLDGVVPPSFPTGGFLLINPSQSNGDFQVGDEVENLAVTKSQEEDPLLSFVDVSDLRVAKARQIQPPKWARVLMQSDDVPLLMAGEKDGRRMVIQSFDVHASNLPLLVAFPVLTANIVGWLGPNGSLGVPTEAKAGEPVTLILDPKAREVGVKRPDGSYWRAEAKEGSTTYAETDWLGVYEVTQQLDGGATRLARFAVNLADSGESDITPASTIPLQGENFAEASTAQIVKREFWWPLVAAALLVLLFEWWVDQRRRVGRRSAKPAAGLRLDRVVEKFRKLSVSFK